MRSSRSVAIFVLLSGVVTSVWSQGLQTRPQYRGVTSPQTYLPGEFADLRTWNANLFRWEIFADKKNPDGSAKPLQPSLDELATGLEEARRNGIKVVICLMVPPGGRDQDRTMAMFEDSDYYHQFLAFWTAVATRFRGNPAVYGYDLLNEPTAFHSIPSESHDWMQSEIEAGRAIRKIDAMTPIIFEVANWDNPGPYGSLKPVPLTNVIYEVHMYEPHDYTHQGVDAPSRSFDGFLGPPSYPGRIGLQSYDRDKLRAILQPVREFQLKYHVKIYCGEFSAIRWAPGADKWLEDVTSILEEFGWDYTYHAFREWQGWDLEMPESHDLTRPASPGPREKVLLKRFALNATFR